MVWWCQGRFFVALVLRICSRHPAALTFIALLCGDVLKFLEIARRSQLCARIDCGSQRGVRIMGGLLGCY